MVSRQARHLLAQRIFWSIPGRWIVRLVDLAAPRWNYVVLNRSLDMQVNGERWLASLLPADALVPDVGLTGSLSSVHPL